MKQITEKIVRGVVTNLVWVCAFGMAAMVPIIYSHAPKMIIQNYKKNYETLMTLADKDRNGIVSFEEQADAWERMGYKVPFSKSEFPKPNISEIEKAIESYERESNLRRK